jgi:hypothetical protein
MTFKYKKIMHVAIVASCMTQILIAANAAGCTPHAQFFLMKPPKLLQL